MNFLKMGYLGEIFWKSLHKPCVTYFSYCCLRFFPLFLWSWNNFHKIVTRLLHNLSYYLGIIEENIEYTCTWCCSAVHSIIIIFIINLSYSLTPTLCILAVGRTYLRLDNYNGQLLKAEMEILANVKDFDCDWAPQDSSEKR